MGRKTTVSGDGAPHALQAACLLLDFCKNKKGGEDQVGPGWSWPAPETRTSGFEMTPSLGQEKLEKASGCLTQGATRRNRLHLTPRHMGGPPACRQLVTTEYRRGEVLARAGQHDQEDQGRIRHCLGHGFYPASLAKDRAVPREGSQGHCRGLFQP